jgi:hypothetical protein
MLRNVGHNQVRQSAQVAAGFAVMSLRSKPPAGIAWQNFSMLLLRAARAIRPSPLLLLLQYR